jgi:type II secretory pathway component GspD/PulD (secretin)
MTTTPILPTHRAQLTRLTRKLWLSRLACAAAIATSTATFAQPLPPPSQPPIQPTVQTPPPAAAGVKPVISDLRFEAIPLPDVLEFLRDSTGQNIVLQAGAGIDPASIKLSYRLKNVTLDAFLDLLTQRPDVAMNLQTVGDPGGPIYVLTIPGREVQAPGGLFGGRGNAEQTGVVSLEVAYADRPPEQAAKIADEVSALVNAAAQAGPANTPPPKVFVHPETKLVLFRGTPEQVELLKQMFQQLDTAAERRRVNRVGDEKADARVKQALAEVATREDALNAARVQAQQMQTKMAEREMQVVQLQARLEEMERQLDTLRRAAGPARPDVAPK